MEDRERWDINDKDHDNFDKRISALEERAGNHDVQYATIKTKLSAILWGIGVLGMELIGVLVKLVFGV